MAAAAMWQGRESDTLWAFLLGYVAGWKPEGGESKPSGFFPTLIGHVILSAAKNLACHLEILRCAQNDMSDLDWE